VPIIGFGKIGARSAKRFTAMGTNVLIYDPYMYSETIRGMGCEPVRDLDPHRRCRSTSSTRGPTPPGQAIPDPAEFIAAPHVDGVTREAADRLGAAAVENILSVLDGKPIRDNVVNKEVLD
jgi:D-3-phosphoglycerate dehydrogenase